MKYMLSWTTRVTGTAAENEQSTKRALQLYQKWTPLSGLQILAWVARIDGEGGYALVETDDAATIADISGKFGPLLVSQVHPVMEMADWAQVVGAGIEWRGSV